MSQDDFVIANQGFPAFRSDLNANLQALASTSSGATAPSTTYANQLWYDTANDILKIRNEANSAWINVITLDQTNNKNSSITVPTIDSGTSTALTLKSGTTTAMTIDTSQNVGIGTSSPSSYGLLAISKAGVTTFAINNSSAAATGYIQVDNGSNFNIFSAGTVFIGPTGANPLLFQTNNTERMRIDSSGNVGIGITSPRNLEVARSDANTSYGAAAAQFPLNLRNTDTTANNWAMIGINQGPSNLSNPVSFGAQLSSTTAGSFVVVTSGSERMRVDSSGNVGIGTSSPNGKLEVNNSTVGAEVSRFEGNYTGSGSVVLTNWRRSGGAVASVMRYNDADASMAFGTTTTHAQAFLTNNTERARIDSNGNLLVGTTSGAWIGKLSVASDSSGAYYPLALNNTASGSTSYPVVDIYRAGTRTGTISNTNTATAYNTSSDYRLKENVQPMTTGLATIVALKPVTYDWIIDKSKGEGFIAHELQEVVPLAVTGEKDAVDENGNINPQGVDYSKIVVHLVAACQEQQKLIIDLQNRLEKAGL